MKIHILKLLETQLYETKHALNPILTESHLSNKGLDREIPISQSMYVCIIIFLFRIL